MTCPGARTEGLAGCSLTAGCTSGQFSLYLTRTIHPFFSYDLRLFKNEIRLSIDITGENVELNVEVMVVLMDLSCCEGVSVSQPSKQGREGGG